MINSTRNGRRADSAAATGNEASSESLEGDEVTQYPADATRASRSGLTKQEWREFAAEFFAPLRMSFPPGHDFRAEVHQVAVGDVHLHDMVTDPHIVTRSPDLISGNEAAFCKLSLQLAGTSRLAQDDRECVLYPGDLALYVTQRPYELSYTEPQHGLVVHFPASYVQMPPDQMSMVTARPISRDQGLGKVAVPLFEQLAQNMDLLHGAHAMNLIRSALDMLVTVLSAESQEHGQDLADSFLLHEAMSFIEHHLSDPDLGPSRIAAHLYVSVRQLHSRFASHRLTVASYIRNRRLQAIRQDLANPLLSNETVHTISARYGLLDPSHVSKAFKAEYGESPSVYRTRVLQDDAA